MRRVSWLHLTDLHLGQPGQGPLWPELKERFFEDLGVVHEHTGPWDLVVFSGDLVQSGSKDQYAALETTVLAPLWDRFEQLGSTPRLLAVPGNHDLQRPTPITSAVQVLLDRGIETISDKMFNNDMCEYREVIDGAFANYSEWWDSTKFRHAGVRRGFLPGEFSVTVELGGFRLGVVGLNTAFLQLADGDYQGRLVLDPHQLNHACTQALHGDAPAWIASHDVCLLVTHHGPEWIQGHATGGGYDAINPAGRFAVHLFGHMHEKVSRGNSQDGGEMRWLWQGNSLFGLERHGASRTVERRHGYSAGSIAFDGATASMRHWPRRAVDKGPNGWDFDRDVNSSILDKEADHGGTRAVPVTLHRKHAPAADHGEPARRPGSSLSGGGSRRFGTQPGDSSSVSLAAYDEWMLFFKLSKPRALTKSYVKTAVSTLNFGLKRHVRFVSSYQLYGSWDGLVRFALERSATRNPDVAKDIATEILRALEITDNVSNDHVPNKFKLIEIAEVEYCGPGSFGGHFLWSGRKYREKNVRRAFIILRQKDWPQLTDAEWRRAIKCAKEVATSIGNEDVRRNPGRLLDAEHLRSFWTAHRSTECILIEGLF